MPKSCPCTRAAQPRTSYTVTPATFKADGIKVGENIMVTFEVKDGKNVATAAVPAK